MKLLVIEDDEQLADLLKINLTQQSYVVDTAADGLEGWDLLQVGEYDLVLLDVMLPKLDGIALCQRLRSRNRSTLIMLMSARDTNADRVLGLDAGADDYVVKPVAMSELTARIRALLRRRRSTIATVLEWGNLRLDPTSLAVSHGATQINLTAKEYTLLELFLRNPQRVFSQTAILSQVWSVEDELRAGETVRSHIRRLRQKLKTAQVPDLIETVYGLGYRLDPEFQTESASPTAPTHTAAPLISAETTWELYRPKIMQRLQLFETTVQALRQGTLDATLQHQTYQECHRLKGTLGMLGWSVGADLVRQMEVLLHPDNARFSSQGVLLERLVHQLQQFVALPPPPIGSAHHLPPILSGGRNPPATLRLLIVEPHEAGMQRFLAATHPAGLQTVPVPTPKAALASIARVQADAVLLNLSQPRDWTAGLALLTDLAQRSPAIPAFVMVDPNVTPDIAIGAVPDNSCDRVAIARFQGRGMFTPAIDPQQILEHIYTALTPAPAIEARILVLDDDVITLRLLEAALSTWGFHVTTLSHPLEFWPTLETVMPDLLILDLQMPDLDGIELCQQLRSHTRWNWLPVLMLTGTEDMDTIQQVFAAGADEYAQKPIIAPEMITRILNRLERTRVLRDRIDFDSISNLPNRQRSSRDFHQLLQSAEQLRQSACFSVIVIHDLRQINQQYGHSMGDRVIRHVAQQIRHHLCPDDVLARWDGAEFVVGLASMQRHDGQVWLAEILAGVRSHLPTHALPLPLRFSVGVAQYPEDGADLPALYQSASQILTEL